MPLLGTAAMLLAFDIAPEAIEEHDDWHTHEHLPERLSIPGFRRGTRWVAEGGGPRYFVVYEVAELATLSSEPYLVRLNNPSEWTRRMMPSYRGMRRGFCALTASFGMGLGHAALVVRFRPREGAGPGLREWLVNDALPPLASRRGIGSAHLFERGAVAPMTSEQRIRGADATFDWAVLVTGYGADEVRALAQEALGAAALEARGAEEVVATSCRLDYALTAPEAGQETPA